MFLLLLLFMNNFLEHPADMYDANVCASACAPITYYYPLLRRRRSGGMRWWGGYPASKTATDTKLSDAEEATQQHSICQFWLCFCFRFMYFLPCDRLDIEIFANYSFQFAEVAAPVSWMRYPKNRWPFLATEHSGSNAEKWPSITP